MPPRSPLRTFEIATASAVVVAVLLHVLLYAEVLSRTSMNSDELGSVVAFTARGPWYAMTHYPIPRNHILFSAVASMLPGAGQIDALRARSLSFAVAALLGGAILLTYFRHGKFFEGSLLFALWGLSGDLIHLSLQARGYGMLCLFAFLSCIFAVRYCEKGSLRDFAFLALCTTFGAYTVPTYICFGLPLMLLLAIRCRSIKALAWTGGSLLLIALLYLPVAGQFRGAASGYAQKYGEFYTGFGSVVETVRTFFWSLSPWPAMALFSVAVLAPFFAFSAGNPRARALQSLSLASLLFLMFCLWMRTPPIRTTAFIALPVGFCLVEAFGILWRHTQRTALAWTLSALLLTGGTGLALSKVASFRFIPYENWLEAWQFIEEMFPPGTVVDCSYMADGLTYYIDQDRYLVKLGAGVPPGFRAGAIPAVSAPFVRGAHLFDPSRHCSAWATVTLPGKVRDVQIHFALPAVTRITGIDEPSGAPLPSPASSIAVKDTIRVRLNPADDLHSLNLLFDHTPSDLDLTVVLSSSAGKPMPIDPAGILRIGNVFTLPLPAHGTREALIHLHTNITGISVKSIWAMPGSWR